MIFALSVIVGLSAHVAVTGTIVGAVKEISASVTGNELQSPILALASVFHIPVCFTLYTVPSVAVNDVPSAML